jgi:hypothetical protein
VLTGLDLDSDVYRSPGCDFQACEARLSVLERYLQEVDEEDDGVWHASDALGSLLQAKLLCSEERVELPAGERDQAAAKILGPLLAQAACLRWP